MGAEDVNDASDEEFVSKTQRKKEMLALQELGEELVNLGAADLAKIPMDDAIKEAVELARRINRKKDGFRRQLQFIGKLFRKYDVTAIEAALEKIRNRHNTATAKFHKLEALRDSLLKNGDQGIQDTLETNPSLDRQKLRQLVRQAAKEQQQNKPPKAARELFQYLKAELGTD